MAKAPDEMTDAERFLVWGPAYYGLMLARASRLLRRVADHLDKFGSRPAAGGDLFGPERTGAPAHTPGDLVDHPAVTDKTDVL